MDRGSFTEHDGRPAVRFERTYPHPVERVWAAVSEPEGLAHWFPSTVSLEPRAGGTIAFSGDPHMEPTTGTVLRYDPPHALSFTWGGDELHFELAPTSDGGCTLVLIDVLEARDTAARNATGWTVCLGELEKHLAGREAPGPHQADTEPFQPLYDSYVAAGMPHGAEIPGRPASVEE
ncbi:SRPBCC family protein [Streptomyces sp. JJ36]|uniref:SRPBCC family protein n=1 Tax=Streptomyces sp. JJ36 TaxID=2736645 RepID=UPI001F33CAC3|nr:SRPBCC family protein [Streptomyces sp. JJ36]MCF6522142.1 SRPBCC family protein [Streptomyces sp. JJ36]